MLELFWTENTSVYEKLKILLARRLGESFEILRTANGKPYIKDNPFCFSVSHSASGATIAVCDKPVGVDCEKIKQRKFDAVLSRFTERERLEIGGDIYVFLKNWTVKEAFIKLNGGTLARDLKRLEYFENTLYLDGQEAACGYCIKQYDDYLIAVCAERYSSRKLAAVKIQSI